MGHTSKPDDSSLGNLLRSISFALFLESLGHLTVSTESSGEGRMGHRAEAPALSGPKVTLCASRKNFRSAECNYTGWKGAKILALTSPPPIKAPWGQNYRFLHC